MRSEEGSVVTQAARLYYREPPPSTNVEEVGIAPNPRGRPFFNGTPHACTFREAVDATYVDLTQHMEGWFFRARQLSDMSTRDEIREVTGIRMKLQRAARNRAALYLMDRDLADLASRALFDVFVYGTPTYERYDPLRRRVYETTKKRRAWVAKYEADPERIASKRARREDAGVKAERRAKESDPQFKAAEAARRRAAYYAAKGKPVPPEKSARGRKPTLKEAS